MAPDDMTGLQFATASAAIARLLLVLIVELEHSISWAIYYLIVTHLCFLGVFDDILHFVEQRRWWWYRVKGC